MSIKVIFMKASILSTTESAAYGAKLAGVEVVPHFPAPFSVDIVKTLSKIHNCDVFDVTAAGDAFAAAIGSAATGKRTLIPTSSPFSYEVLAAPFMRLPFVAVNMSRSQHGIKIDHTSIMALRDAGYLMFFPETNQEIYDTVVQAYKICEDQKVMLPAIINVDGLPSFSEPVQIANDQSVKTFLTKYKASKLDMKKPFHLDIYSNKYGDGKLQMNKGMEGALELTKKVDEQWKQKFHRSYGLVEHHTLEDAETVIVTMGYHSSTAKAAVRRMRAEGKKVGLLRIRVFRPWPREAVAKALENAKKVVIFEQAVSIGAGGILRAHIGKGSQLICLGKYPSEKDFMEAVSRVEKSDKDIKLWL